VTAFPEAHGTAQAYSAGRTPARERRWRFVDASVVLASAEDQVIDETVAALAQRDQARHHSAGPDGRRREVRQLFRLVLRCVRRSS
jgi:hypothetical protein